MNIRKKNKGDMTVSIPKRVMFYVQHLLGVGHVRRAELISNALVQQGFAVHVILGGDDVSGITFPGSQVHRLPSARAADSSFSTIVDSQGKPVTDQWRGRRRDLLLEKFASIDPDILLIEQFPFGRRQFRFELLVLLEAAKTRGKPISIACSVRDLLVNKHKPERTQETVDVVDQYFDRVFVHGDEKFLPFEVSFDATKQLKDKLSYTGYVTPPPPRDGGIGKGEVIVAAGGGAVGGKLLSTALAAKSLSSFKNHVWRILIGPNLDDGMRKGIESRQTDGIVIEPNRPDYLSLLSECAVSVSQAGYNTLMDIITARCPALVVPFSEANETEQSVRAELLAKSGHVTLISPDDLDPDVLARGINEASERATPQFPPFLIDGAARTAHFMTQLM